MAQDYTDGGLVPGHSLYVGDDPKALALVGSGNPLPIAGQVTTDGVADAVVTSASVTSAVTVVSASTKGYMGGSFQVVSAGTGCTITYEQSNDNVNWVALPVINTASSATSPLFVTTGGGLFAFYSAAAYVRARVSTYGSGTVTVALAQKRQGQPSNVGLLGSTAALGTVGVTSLPALVAGTNAIGNVNVSVGYTDSTGTLVATGIYSGTGRATTSMAAFAFFNAWAFSDQPGTLYIDLSLDGSGRYDPVVSAALAAGSSVQLSVRLCGAFSANTLYRVRYVNGPNAQGVFRLGSSFTD